MMTQRNTTTGLVKMKCSVAQTKRHNHDAVANTDDGSCAELDCDGV